MSECKVYLGNLSYDTGERDIEKFLKGYGRIRNISVKEGFGFAEFEDRRDAEDVVKDLDGKDLDGRRIRVEHTRGSGGGGGGGGGRRDFGDRDRGGFGGRRVSFDWLCVMSVFLPQLHFSHLVPGPDTAWWLKTSHPPPRGRT